MAVTGRRVIGQERPCPLRFTLISLHLASNPGQAAAARLVCQVLAAPTIIIIITTTTTTTTTAALASNEMKAIPDLRWKAKKGGGGRREGEKVGEGEERGEENHQQQEQRGR